MKMLGYTVVSFPNSLSNYTKGRESGKFHHYASFTLSTIFQDSLQGVKPHTHYCCHEPWANSFVRQQ